ncbi:MULTISPECIES: phosphoesterase [unclassified Bacillus (in: firmicutes)]|uniref:phosphoesterase n=1 Tax=unclassified Bacillus (in: firmicutes) TaxID=185979 RepID=UPI0006AE5AE6|nr:MULTISPECIES: phosphoesterase [unclassified Bacillus (in: firmicutes)]ALC87909.1 phosphoesterase [Bacillus sp. FJAT-22090]MDF2068490.1 phosphoesterase [Bacillus sp. Cr_A10]
MKKRAKKAIPLIATTVLATTAFATQAFTTNGNSQTVAANQLTQEEVKQSNGTWLAGDHHVHSEWSVGWDNSTNPPTPIQGGDAIYPIVKNAEKATEYGLEWVMTTDHGGPNHSKVNLEQAYPELLKSREAYPELIQFYGMEFDTPAADHSTLMIPKVDNESQILYDIESQFNKREPYPNDGSRDTESTMIEALNYMLTELDEDEQPIHIAHHPSRSAKGDGEWGQDTPEEFRNWNDIAPNISIGMEGAPGHQAAALTPDGELDDGARGSYGNYPTMGGYDQMAAKVGGLWDSMLGEGRHWWITATSDSHVNWRDGGSDFWPGEYSKTYVKADKDYDDIMESLRGGNVYVTTGDLISELDVKVQAGGKSPIFAQSKGSSATLGETLTIPGKSKDVTVTIRIKDPNAANANGDTPEVKRVDLIMGEVTGKVEDRSTATNPTTKVVKRFTEEDWTKNGEYIEISYTLENVDKDSYIRLRGTNTDQLEPETDPRGEDPWTDLWFYSNPVFIKTAK